MSHKYSGGCEHIHTHSESDPIDNHTCLCSVCKGVTGQDTTHVVFLIMATSQLITSMV